MIFVTVGTNPTLHFNRLVKAMDILAAEMDEPVVIQTGCSTYIPVHADYFAFTDSEHIEQLNRAARIIVSHAAAGSVITALRHRKPVVVVPRRHYLKEHIDDHQLELARALEEQGRAVAVFEPSVGSLYQAIQLATEQGPSGDGAGTLMRALRAQLDAWHTGPTRIVQSAGSEY